jgi:two-component system cell cycle response regulator
MMVDARIEAPRFGGIGPPVRQLTLSSTPLSDLTAANHDPCRLLEQADWQLYIDSRRAGELGQAALAATQDQPTLALRGDAYFHVGLSLLRSGRVAPAIEANERARASFAMHGDARGLLMCEQFDATHLHAQGRLQEALALHLRIVGRTDVVRRPTDLYICHNSRAITRKLLNQHDYMLLDFYEALNAAKLCESPGPHINALTNLGGSHTDLWNLTEAQRLSEEALDLAEAAGAWTAFAVAVFNLAQIYDGLGLPARCTTLLQRIKHNEDRLPPSVLANNTSLMAIAHLCAGDLEGARAWLDRGVTAMFSDQDGKTDYARAHASYLMAQGRNQEARDVLQARIAEAAVVELKDAPYSRMRLLQVATDVCERLDDAAAALRYLRESQGLYETLVGRSSRAGFIATQVAHEYAVARDDRDRAREAHERAENDRRRLAMLNDALEERMRESQHLNDALQQKIAEAEALQEQLREQAVRDPLTGLYNRRFLAETSVARIELARRQDTTIAIVLIDVDHFKQINDQHGHARGDEVLQHFAALLRDRMRRSDVVCRFGGEEFLLLVDNCDEATLVEILEGLMQQFRALRLGSGAQAIEGSTFSAGVAVLDVDGTDFESLVRVADARMYRAKAAGRARVCRSD